MSAAIRLVALQEGQLVPYGGDRVAAVSADLAAAFRDGDHLVVVHDSGDLLHIPRAQHELASRAVGNALDAFAALGAVVDEQISDFFDAFAALLADDDAFAPIAAANEADVATALARGRSTTRLQLSPSMRAGMVAGLRLWRDTETSRSHQLSEVRHTGWTVGAWRAPLGVVGFVFEGRPNVFADACGVLRTGNTVVFRIGSDALGTARAIVQHALQPALDAAGLPSGAVQLIDDAAHAAGWALFADRRLGLAVARGSGPAVAQLGAVARQQGTPVSLHGTGGAWLVAAASANAGTFEAAVLHSLDRKVCNTMNVCCIVRERAGDLVPAFHRALPPGTVVHELSIDDPQLGHEWEWEDVPEVSLVVVDRIEDAVGAFNRFSPRFAASLISGDADEHEQFYAAIESPFVGDGFTRWVDGQFALDQPELGLSNWQHGRLFARGGVLSGDSVFTVRLRAQVHDPRLHR